MKYLVAFIAALVALAGCAIGSVAPDLTKAEFKGSRFGMCPDGTVIEMKVYDLDPADAEAVAVLFVKGAQNLAIVNRKENKVYVFGDKKTYTLDEVREKYPTPCDLPPGTGV